MSKPLSELSKSILQSLQQHQAKMLHEIYTAHAQAESKKAVYDALYRLEQQGLVQKTTKGYLITAEGAKLIHNFFPVRDGVWKLITFDIPESKRPVRNFLRQKLQALGFKKWQNSLWVSPYALDPELEQELLQLAQKFFVRLIKTTDINYDKDLKKLFPEN
jgi:DNA-binding transcriptional regulator PaaX